MTAILSATTSARAARLSARRLVWAGPLAGLVATAVSLGVLEIAGAQGVLVAGPFAGPGSVARIDVIQISAVCLVAGCAAALVLALLARVTSRPRVFFLPLALAALMLSFIVPFALMRSAAVSLALCAMHVAAAVAITTLLLSVGLRRD